MSTATLVPVPTQTITRTFDPAAGVTVFAAGSGPDTLILNVSGTPYAGEMPQFSVSVDGQRIGGVFTAEALHGQGFTSVQLHGAWGAGAHKVQIHYVNDAFNPNADWSNPAAAMAVPGNDRNLFVDGMAWNGKLIPGAAGGIYTDQPIYGAFAIDPATATGTRGVVDPAQYGLTAADVAAQQAAEVAALATTPKPLTDVATAGGDFDLAAYYAQHGITAADLARYDAIAANPEAALQVAQSGAFTFNGLALQLRIWEDFQDGAGIFGKMWGKTEVLPSVGLVSRVEADGDFSGIMTSNTGPGDGLGYGVYILAGSIPEGGRHPGAYFCLWPSDNRWPGPELDLVEVLPDGRAYGTHHWARDGNRGTGGRANDGWHSTVYDGINAADPHWYWIDWQRPSAQNPAGRLTFGVDDRAYYSTTEHVPLAYEDGGTNLSPGIGNKFEGFPNAGHLQGFVYATHAAGGTDQPLL